MERDLSRNNRFSSKHSLLLNSRRHVALAVRPQPQGDGELKVHSKPFSFWYFLQYPDGQQRRYSVSTDHQITIHEPGTIIDKPEWRLRFRGRLAPTSTIYILYTLSLQVSRGLILLKWLLLWLIDPFHSAVVI